MDREINRLNDAILLVKTLDLAAVLWAGKVEYHCDLFRIRFDSLLGDDIAKNSPEVTPMLHFAGLSFMRIRSAS